MKKIKNKKIVFIALAVLVLVGGVMIFQTKAPIVPNTQTYTDADYGFSFSYPREYQAKSFSDIEDTKTVLVQSGDVKQGVQVFVSAFDEDITLTHERIKKEMPDLVILEPKNLPVDGVTGISFKSTNAFDTESYEMWLVRKGKFYQVSAPIVNKNLFDAIITTWKWIK